MIAAVYVLYVLNCLFLILTVLLQAGKGDSMGAVFGGASNTLLGNRGAATFLSKLTVLSAVLFMVLSIVLAYHSSAPNSRVQAATPAAEGAEGAEAEEGEPGEEAAAVEESPAQTPAVDTPAVTQPASEGTGSTAQAPAGEGTGAEGMGQPAPGEAAGTGSAPGTGTGTGSNP